MAMTVVWSHPSNAAYHQSTASQPDSGTDFLISDASVQKSKQSRFVWTLAHDNWTLWRRVGLAPGHAEDIYSGHAEAFGLLAGLIFLK